jgi:hypothetical protein
MSRMVLRPKLNGHSMGAQEQVPTHTIQKVILSLTKD